MTNRPLQRDSAIPFCRNAVFRACCSEQFWKYFFNFLNIVFTNSHKIYSEFCEIIAPLSYLLMTSIDSSSSHTVAIIFDNENTRYLEQKWQNDAVKNSTTWSETLIYTRIVCSQSRTSSAHPKNPFEFVVETACPAKQDKLSFAKKRFAKRYKPSSTHYSWCVPILWFCNGLQIVCSPH